MTLPNPYTRKEKILKNIAEGTQEFPDAQTREELYLIDIAKKYKGGSLPPVASGSVDGLMSSADKTKLGGIATGANKSVNATTGTPGLVKKMTAIEKPAGVEGAQLKTTVDALIDALKTAGMME